MVRVTKIVEENIAPKVDAKFVAKALGSLPDDAGIVFVCTNDDWRTEDAWQRNGVRFFRIVLPYRQVLDMPPDEVRALMLSLAKERLGLTGKKPAPALAQA